MKRSAAYSYDYEREQEIQLSFEGTGTPDTSKHEWREYQMRETLGTIVLLPGLLTYQSMALGIPESIVRKQTIDKMVQPCGSKPESASEKMFKQAQKNFDK